MPGITRTIRYYALALLAVPPLALAPLPAAGQAPDCDAVAGYYDRGSGYLDEDEYIAAIAEFGRAISMDRQGSCPSPPKGLARLKRGISYTREGNYTRAITDLKRAGAQDPALKAEITPYLVKAYRARGIEALQRGDYDKAIEDFDDVLWLAPDDKDVRETRRQAYRERGQSRRNGSAADREDEAPVARSTAPAAPARPSKDAGQQTLAPAGIAALFAISALLFWLYRRAAGRTRGREEPPPPPAVMPPARSTRTSAPARAHKASSPPAAAAGPDILEVKALIKEEKYEEARDLLARKKRHELSDYELFLEIYIRLDDFMRAELTANQIGRALRDGLGSDYDYALYLSLSDECRARGEDALASRLRGIAVDWMLQALSIQEEPRKFQELAEAMEKEGETEHALKIYRRLSELRPPWPGAAEKYKGLKDNPAGAGGRSVTPAPRKTEVLPPALIIGNRYELKHTLGEGGMGVVYEAWDLQLKRRTAVKRMHSWLKQYPAEYARFRKEAEIVARLKHQNIVGVHGIIEHGGDIFLVFDYVDGRSLHDVLRDKKRLPLKDCLDILGNVCGAVDHAHRNNVIHRDLKPGNIMLDLNGRAMVMDFGLASELKESFSRVSHQTVSGTPAYMAPEQHSGTVKRESDIYSLGVCLYEMLTGELPFQGPDILGQKLREEYKEVSSRLPWLPAGLDAVMDRALQPEPSQRYAGALDLFKALTDL